MPTKTPQSSSIIIAINRGKNRPIPHCQMDANWLTSIEANANAKIIKVNQPPGFPLSCKRLVKIAANGYSKSKNKIATNASGNKNAFCKSTITVIKIKQAAIPAQNGRRPMRPLNEKAHCCNVIRRNPDTMLATKK